MGDVQEDQGQQTGNALIPFDRSTCYRSHDSRDLYYLFHFTSTVYACYVQGCQEIAPFRWWSTILYYFHILLYRTNYMKGEFHRTEKYITRLIFEMTFCLMRGFPSPPNIYLIRADISTWSKNQILLTRSRGCGENANRRIHTGHA